MLQKQTIESLEPWQHMDDNFDQGQFGQPQNMIANPEKSKRQPKISQSKQIERHHFSRETKSVQSKKRNKFIIDKKIFETSLGSQEFQNKTIRQASFISSCQKVAMFRKLAIQDRANLEAITDGLPLKTTQFSLNEEFPWRCEQNKNSYNIRKCSNLFPRPVTSISFANCEEIIHSPDRRSLAEKTLGPEEKPKKISVEPKYQTLTINKTLSNRKDRRPSSLQKMLKIKEELRQKSLHIKLGEQQKFRVKLRIESAKKSCLQEKALIIKKRNIQ